VRARAAILGALAAAALAVGPGATADLFARGNWPALASDRPAERVGDSLTVVIDQTSVASNTAQSGSRKSTNVSGQISTLKSSRSGQLGVSGDFAGSGQSGRSDKVLAQISVVVDAVLPNGDLHVSGDQALNINGEHVKIRIKGRVRRADITTNNTVLSTSLADAVIDYDGTGFTSRSAKPGIVGWLFSWLGVL
jgi:flagellar L-ring protein precursor FlgH